MNTTTPPTGVNQKFHRKMTTNTDYDAPTENNVTPPPIPNFFTLVPRTDPLYVPRDPQVVVVSSSSSSSSLTLTRAGPLAQFKGTFRGQPGGGVPPAQIEQFTYPAKETLTDRCVGGWLDRAVR